MSWEDQGRQGHGWFGHGSAPGAGANTQPDSGADALFDPTNSSDRFDAIAHAAIANLSAADRNRGSASFDVNGAKAPLTSEWKEGDMVQGNTGIKPGTVIATFDKSGRYTNSKESHAAIYLGQDEHGTHVIDQWNNRDENGNITSQQPPNERTLPFNDPRHTGVNGGNSYHVVK